LIDIPKDVQFASGAYIGPKNVQHKSYQPQVKGDLEKIREAVKMMGAAKKPVFYTGGGVINDILNRNTNKQLSSNSRPNWLVFATNYTLQKYFGNKWMNLAVADWQIGAVLQYGSGLPIQAPAVTGNNNNNTLLRATYSQRVEGQPLYLVDNINCGCFDYGHTQILNPAAWTDTPSGQFSPSAAYYNDFRYQRRPQELASIARVFRLKEGISLMIRGEFNNVLNRTLVATTNTAGFVDPSLNRGAALVKDAATGLEEEHLIAIGKHVIVFKGDFVKKGQQLTEGPVVPHEILDVCGTQELQEHLVNEIQEVYRVQGVTINDKHIEIIIRQMLRKVRITEPGDTTFLWGEQIDKIAFDEENARVEKMGGKPAEGAPVLLGITKASLETESFLSAASFQDTTRVLTDAATMGKHDYLRGFKENVIMGHIIPGGTGFVQYRGVKLKPLVEEPPVEEAPAPAEETAPMLA